MSACLAAALVVAALGQASTRTVAASGSRGPVAHAATGCSDTFPDHNPDRHGNPLGLQPAPPASNPLSGAQFTVGGPYFPRGSSGGFNYAASEIVRILGLGSQVGPNKAIKPTTTWTEFETALATGKYHKLLLSKPAAVRNQVNALALLASQETPSRITAQSGGGTIAGIHAQTQKVFCAIVASDPQTIPVIVTYFLHPALGGNPTTQQIENFMPKFKQQIEAVTSAIGNRPVVALLEIDAFGSSQQMVKSGAITAWEAALGYEMGQFEALPHAAVYVEGGYSDSNSVDYTVKRLKAVHVGTIQGFFTNDTHNQWTSHEVAWASKIARRVNTHFIVNTSDNGQGPKLNPKPQTQGVEDNCNPTTTGIGIPPTTGTNVPRLDAYLWTHPPAISAGRCRSMPGSGVGWTGPHGPLRTFPGPGGSNPPPNGTFWPAKAVAMVDRANARFGPPRGVPSLGGPDGQARGNKRSISIPYGNRVPRLDVSPPEIPGLPSAPAPKHG